MPYILFLFLFFYIPHLPLLQVSDEYKPHPAHCCLLLTFLLVPFPLVVAVQQIWTLFHPTPQMQVKHHVTVQPTPTVNSMATLVTR